MALLDDPSNEQKKTNMCSPSLVFFIVFNLTDLHILVPLFIGKVC